MRNILAAMLLPTFVVSAAVAQVPLGFYDCYRTPDPLILDGVLDEPAWQAATGTGLFRMDTGAPGTAYPTNAWMLWDDTNLYVAFECEDTDMYSSYTQRDGPLYTQDVVEVFIMDQTSTEGYYLEYEVSARGVLFDKYMTHPSPGLQGDLSWDSAFDATVIADGTLDNPDDTDTGYLVEMAIPLADAYGPGGAPADGEMVRMNLYRIDYTTADPIGGTGDNTQLITWSPTLRGAFHTPDRFGELTFHTAAPPGYRHPGDANLDGHVDLNDFVLLKQNWGAGTTWGQGDFDGDGTVDLDDFLILKQHFARSIVPEPATLSLLVIGATGIVRRRR